MGIPYCFAYNKDHCDSNGPAPVLASFQNEAIELINTSPKFVYHEPAYRELKATTYKVFYAYQRYQEPKDPDAVELCGI